MTLNDILNLNDSLVSECPSDDWTQSSSNSSDTEPTLLKIMIWAC